MYPSTMIWPNGQWAIGRYGCQNAFFTNLCNISETVQPIAAKCNPVIVCGEIHALNGFSKRPMSHWLFGLPKCLFLQNMQYLGNSSTDCSQIWPGDSMWDLTNTWYNTICPVVTFLVMEQHVYTWFFSMSRLIKSLYVHLSFSVKFQYSCTSGTHDAPKVGILISKTNIF